MKKYILLVMLLSYSQSLFSTAIVIYITPDFVIMGADSKGVFTTIQSGAESSSVVPKIFERRKVYFALAGITSNNVRHFDVAALVDQQLKSTKNLDEAIKKVKLAVTRSLLTYLRSMKAQNNALYRHNVASAVYITSVGLITIRNKKPYAHILGFQVHDGPNIAISVEEQYFSVKHAKDAVYYLGQTDAINSFLDTLKSADTTPGLFVEKLINLQIARTPLLVGPPIDIIRLTPQTTTWLKRKKGIPVKLN